MNSTILFESKDFASKSLISMVLFIFIVCSSQCFCAEIKSVKNLEKILINGLMTLEAGSSKPQESISTTKLCKGKQKFKGLRELYFDVKRINLGVIASLSYKPIFISGSHVRQKDSEVIHNFDLKSHTIARYNPEFINLLKTLMSSIMKNKEFIRKTRCIFHLNIELLAVQYYEAYLILFNPKMEEILKEITTRFEETLANYTSDMEEIRLSENYKLSPSYRLTENLRVISDQTGRPYWETYHLRLAMSFWVRRSLNDTHHELFSILQTVLRAYNIEETHSPQFLINLDLKAQSLVEKSAKIKVTNTNPNPNLNDNLLLNDEKEVPGRFRKYLK